MRVNMDTVKFIDERNRMCRSFAVACHDAENKRCPAFKVNKDGLLCAVGRESTMDAKDQIAIVESWSSAHPVKTRQSAFFGTVADCKNRQRWLPGCLPVFSF